MNYSSKLNKRQVLFGITLQKAGDYFPLQKQQLTQPTPRND